MCVGEAIGGRPKIEFTFSGMLHARSATHKVEMGRWEAYALRISPSCRVSLLRMIAS